MPAHVSFILTGLRHGRAFAADATYHTDGRTKPVVVFVHGFKGFKDWGHFPHLADFFANQGFVFVKLNLSHNGVVVGGTGDLEDLEAFGRNNFSIELDDLGQLLDALATPGTTPIPTNELDISRLCLVGHSRGGALVLLKAAEDARVRAVATWASIADIDQRWHPDVLAEWQRSGQLLVPNSRTGQALPMYYQIVEDYEQHRARLDIQANVTHRLPQPLLIVHGDADETVPVEAAHSLHAAKPNAEILVVPGGTHMFGGAHPWPSGAGLPEPAGLVAARTAEFFARQA